MTEEQSAPETTEGQSAPKLFDETAPEKTESTVKPATLLQQAPVTAALFAANMIVFIMLVFLTSARSILVPTEQTLIDWSANFGPLTLGGEPWRIISNTFLHVSVFHLAINLYVLFNLGPYAENLLGSRRMFALYMLSGVAGSLSSLVWNPLQVSAGASGALFGLFGCFVEESVLGSGFSLKEILRPARVMLMIAVVISCVYGAFIPGIDNAAHLGGFLAGALLSNFFRQDLKATWNKRDSAVVGVSLTALILATSAEYFSVRTNPQFLAMLDFQNALPLLKEKKYQEALTCLNAAAARSASVEIYLKRANAYCKLGRHEDAIEDCNSALALDPASPEVYLGRGYVRHCQNSEGLAIEDINTAIGLDPKNPVAYNNRAWSYAVLGSWQTAIEDCNKALALAPELALALDTRGLCYLQLGEHKLATEDLTKAAKLDPKDGAALFHRALVNERLGKEKEAAADRFEAQRLRYEPESWEASLSRAGNKH
ncbi:MAG: rhomboid family intramembrane serine protease [Candidatus Melainabacteria bacterium]|nr:rhomboid family intramembrane serine protease [Candidatus Melainabacteria bacterium]